MARTELGKTSGLPSKRTYTVSYTRQTFAIEQIPNIYRTTLQVQHEGIDETLYSSDIYGRRLSLTYASNKPQLRLDGDLLEEGNTVTER